MEAKAEVAAAAATMDAVPVGRTIQSTVRNEQVTVQFESHATLKSLAIGRQR